MSDRALLTAGVICLAAGGVPTLLIYSTQRDPMYGIVLFLTLPLVAIGGSLLLLAVIKVVFLAFGFGSAVATLSTGLIAIAQYFIGNRNGMQGMTAFTSGVFAWCGVALVLASGALWLRSSDRRGEGR